MDLGLKLEERHVLVTGGCGMIGSKVVQAFLSAGSFVTSIDIAPRPFDLDHVNLFVLKADITNEKEFENAWQKAEAKYGLVECCVALASLDLSVLKHHQSLADMDMSQWRRTLDVNVAGTFLTARTWLRALQRYDKPVDYPDRVSLILVGSESGHFGERNNADYAASKSAVQFGLLQSLKADAPRIWPGARVNAIAPGPVATPKFWKECQESPEMYWLEAQATVAQKRPVSMAKVAKSILYLASEAWSGDVHGQILNVDSGKQGKVMWTKEECGHRSSTA
ncbi:NAD(P)-binding protein [Viridothelium virens]|uniref:NAD(P)-binding protein n=1 Tax=Viridothelium virens TaxID=1048519 RepID=A0A6A6H461_VIRVR|nr:NAD(P)-binding protein [Viridothelium virens]